MKFIYVLTLLVVSALVLGTLLGTSSDNSDCSQQMFDTVDSKPYVYRVLVPFVVRSISAVIPDQVENDISEYARERFGKTRVYNDLGFDNVVFTDVVVSLVILYLSILGFAWALCSFARRFWVVNNAFLYILTIVAVAGLPVFFKYCCRIYDLPHLFLFTAALSFLAGKKWTTFLVLLAITTFSKETSVLLILAFVLAFRNGRTGLAFRRLLVAQIAIFVAIKLLISFVFRDNPGGFVELHFFHNLSLRAYSIGQFSGFVAIAAAIAYDWKRKPFFLRQAMWLLAPLLGLALFFGYVDEYRDYYEIYPIIALLIAHTMARVLNVKQFESTPAQHTS